MTKMKRATAEALRKKMYKRNEEQRERDEYQFNQGRLHCDSKWVDAIDERITELEIQIGIPELRRLKKEFQYKWKND